MTSRVIATGFDPAGPFGYLILPARFRQRCKETRFKQEWKLTWEQYIHLMRGWAGLPGRYHQRGSVSAFAYGTVAAAAPPAGGAVVMTDGTWTKTLAGQNTNAGVTFQPDGGTDELGPLIDDRTAHQAGEWWSDEPEADIGSSYDVRALSVGKTGTWSSAAAADDTWIQISAERIWRNVVAGKASPTSKQTIATFEIRDTGSGGALDSAVYNVTASN